MGLLYVLAQNLSSVLASSLLGVFADPFPGAVVAATSFIATCHPRTFRMQLSSAQGHQNHFGCHMLCQWDFFYPLWLTIMAHSCQSRDIVRQSHTADTTLGRHNSVKELSPLCLALCLLDEFCAKELG